MGMLFEGAKRYFPTIDLKFVFFLIKEKKRLQGFLNEMLRVGCLKVQKDCLEAVPDCILFEYKQCDECSLF